MATTTALIPALRRRWRLKIAMEDARFTSSDMATELGVSRATVSRWLASDTAPIKSAFLKQWAAACGVDETWLIYGPTCASCGSMPGPVSNPHPVDDLVASHDLFTDVTRPERRLTLVNDPSRPAAARAA